MRRLSWLLLIMTIAALAGQGCTHVRFNEKERLADRTMIFDYDPLGAEMRGHILTPREGAIGGFVRHGPRARHPGLRRDHAHLEPRERRARRGLDLPPGRLELRHPHPLGLRAVLPRARPRARRHARSLRARHDALGPLPGLVR